MNLRKQLEKANPALLRSTTPDDIKKILHDFLDETTAEDVLQLDREFQSLTSPKEKYALLAQFEAEELNQQPKRNPRLLKEWVEYYWKRLELSNLANQKSTRNKLLEMHKESLEKNKESLEKNKERKPYAPLMTAQDVQRAYEEDKSGNKDRGIPFNTFRDNIVDPPENDAQMTADITDINSVNRAIQEAYIKGVPLSKSIQALSNVKLEIVGTEHPTDPLSQEVRDTLTKIANAMDAGELDTIKELILQLKKFDAIPAKNREVEEEVNRNINMTLDKLYDTLPHLIQSILTAYQTYYSEEFTVHEEEIWQALDNIVAHASWPGFDADGNFNVTPDSMRYAIRLLRIRIAEKHRATLDTYIIEKSKEIERDLREKITELNNPILTHLEKNVADVEDRLVILHLQNTVSMNLINRNFSALMDNYVTQINHIKNIHFAEEKVKNELLKWINEQNKIAESLIKLTSFSGTYLVNGKQTKGALQQFKKIFTAYKASIRDNTDAFEIKDENNHLCDPTEYVLDQYQTIMSDHAEILKEFPELKTRTAIFGKQLRCFKMTYGHGHVRQDSSIYLKVCNAIFHDLKQEEKFQQLPIYSIIKDRSYKDLNIDERSQLLKSLQDGSEKHLEILKIIYHNYHAKIYDRKSKNSDEFRLVCQEFERLELAQDHTDMINTLIISNTEDPATLLAVKLFLDLFSHEKNKKRTIAIVPLLEKRQDLEHYEYILTDWIKLNIQEKLEAAFIDEEKNNLTTLKLLLGIQSKDEIRVFIHNHDRQSFKLFLSTHPALQTYLQDIIIEVMIGYSDTERVSGLAALISIQETIEYLMDLMQDFGVRYKFYYGPGGDVNRGSLKLRPPKGTLQGNARFVLNTVESTIYYTETLFYTAYQIASDPFIQKEFSNKPEHIQQWIKECKTLGTQIYEELHDTHEGLGKLLGYLFGQIIHWLVKILNSSSRATQRGGTADTQKGDRTASVQTDGVRPEAYIDPDKPRAITAAQMNEMLRGYINLIIGLGYALRKLGKYRAERLYESSKTIRDIFDKTLFGIVMADYEIMAHALFAEHLELRPKDPQQRKEWAEECRTKYPAMLKTMDVEAMLQTKQGKEQLDFMLTRLFAYLEEEYHQTKAFIDDLQKSMRIKNPSWIKEAEATKAEVELLGMVLARFNYHVRHGKNLDQVYFGLNGQIYPYSHLTTVGGLIGSVGTGITAARVLPCTFSEVTLNDGRDDLHRYGVERAEKEAIELNQQSLTFGEKGNKFTLFANRDLSALNKVAEEHPKLAERRIALK